MAKKNRHEETLELLVKRIKPKGYAWVRKHWKYFCNGLEGELDAIAFRPKSNCIHYYEVKSNDTVQSYMTAVVQLSRVQRAYPEVHFKGIYITPTTVRRIFNLEHPNGYKQTGKTDRD